MGVYSMARVLAIYWVLIKYTSGCDRGGAGGGAEKGWGGGGW